MTRVTVGLPMIPCRRRWLLPTQLTLCRWAWCNNIDHTSAAEVLHNINEREASAAVRLIFSSNAAFASCVNFFFNACSSIRLGRCTSTFCRNKMCFFFSKKLRMGVNQCFHSQPSFSRQTTRWDARENRSQSPKGDNSPHGWRPEIET